ncbi:hypothetical protein G9A89_016070 [Geosiphon pyriformis]|nr:hypothetical protein G9A89_016070 [Geosiphon pyriformis]
MSRFSQTTNRLPPIASFEITNTTISRLNNQNNSQTINSSINSNNNSHSNNINGDQSTIPSVLPPVSRMVSPSIPILSPIHSPTHEMNFSTSSIHTQPSTYLGTGPSSKPVITRQHSIDSYQSSTNNNNNNNTKGYHPYSEVTSLYDIPSRRQSFSPSSTGSLSPMTISSPPQLSSLNNNNNNNNNNSSSSSSSSNHHHHHHPYHSYHHHHHHHDSFSSSSSSSSRHSQIDPATELLAEKRRRNAGASARFRDRRKQRERDMQEKCQFLERRVQELESIDTVKRINELERRLEDANSDKLNAKSKIRELEDEIHHLRSQISVHDYLTPSSSSGESDSKEYYQSHSRGSSRSSSSSYGQLPQEQRISKPTDLQSLLI